VRNVTAIGGLGEAPRGLGPLVARNVDPCNGHGGDPATRDQRRNRDVGGKVSARESTANRGSTAEGAAR
jgi:hypothetical protein